MPIPGPRTTWFGGLAGLIGLSLLVFGLGLGGPSRLTYHEAFVAQGAREIVASGHWWHPTIGGLPWLEKPPLPFWAVAVLGKFSGGVGPLVARLPSAVAASVLVVGVAILSARWYGPNTGLLAGAVQATTAWAAFRGRLAEADILLACLITWAILAFDRLRSDRTEADPADATELASKHVSPGPGRRRGFDPFRVDPQGHWRRWRWAFFGLLGATSLVKGIGFGAALVLAAVAVTVIWDGDRGVWRRLGWRPGWLLAAALGVAWPLAMVQQHGPRVLGLWLMHVAERVGERSGHGHFAGESWGDYVPAIFGQALPWFPLAMVGAVGSLRRGRPGDRLLWAWAVGPLLLVSVPGGRNAHYAIHAMIPWSVWAALGLEWLGRRRRERLVARGWTDRGLRRLACGAFAGMGLAYGLGLGVLGPRLDRSRAEAAFYATLARRTTPGEPLVLLYDDWDREPYPTPFGPIPHDAALRLFYLERPACWHWNVDQLAAHRAAAEGAVATPPCPHPARGEVTELTLIGRERDLPALARLGRVEVLARGPDTRWDRSYLLARIRPGGPQMASAPGAVGTGHSSAR